MQGTSVRQVTAIGAIIIFLYMSRASYNLVVLGLSNKTINSFDYDWYNVSDQVKTRRQNAINDLLVFLDHFLLSQLKSSMPLTSSTVSMRMQLAAD